MSRGDDAWRHSSCDTVDLEQSPKTDNAEISLSHENLEIVLPLASPLIYDTRRPRAIFGSLLSEGIRRTIQ